jgi:AraC-like DNA-binding protein
MCSAIVGARLCRRDLNDPRLANLTIDEIARHHGYRSAATFSRAFAERYAVSPRASARRRRRSR